MRRAKPIFAATCLLSGLSCLLSAPQARAQSGTNAEICASTAGSAYSPEQRITACGALIDTLKDQPQALEDIFWALLNSTEFSFNH